MKESEAREIFLKAHPKADEDSPCVFYDGVYIFNMRCGKYLPVMDPFYYVDPDTKECHAYPYLMDAHHRAVLGKFPPVEDPLFDLS